MFIDPAQPVDPFLNSLHLLAAKQRVKHRVYLKNVKYLAKIKKKSFDETMCFFSDVQYQLINEFKILLIDLLKVKFYF